MKMSPAPSFYQTNTTVTNKTSHEKTTRWDIKKALSLDTLRRKKASDTKSWTPPGLRPSTLIFMILVSVALLVTLQLFLIRSDRHQGVIFSTRIEDLPLSKTFMYRYFPTIVAVVYSIFWAWIDLDTKRVEPWYRLSREGGSTGKDSLLLTYPFEFAPFVPFRALKRRHWPVFWASFALIMVTFGLVPVQAGIFSVKRIAQEKNTKFNVSTGFLPAIRQSNELGLGYHFSTYGIVALDETLPPYMAMNYTLAPFEPSAVDTSQVGEITGEWTAPTTLYSLDLVCEQTTLQPSTFGTFNSSWGCTFMVGLDGNSTQKVDKNALNSNVKKYSALFAMPYSDLGVTYHIDYCPPDRIHTMYAAFQENKKREEDPPNNVTAIFCELKYYAQDVNATVDSRTQRPKRTVPLGPQRELAEDIFNKTTFEKQFASGQPLIIHRGNSLPARGTPNYFARVVETELTFADTEDNAVGFVTTFGKHPLPDYLNWQTLAKSYANSYQLLFARAMTDVLVFGEKRWKQIDGKTVGWLEAVILDPVFTYIVEGFLAAVSLSALALLYLSLTRSTGLISDPCTMASIMSLVAENKAFLADFKDLDCCSKDELEQLVREKPFKLLVGRDETSIADGTVARSIESMFQTRQRTDLSKQIKKPVRPQGFRLWMAILFIGTFVLIASGLTIIFTKAAANGLPLPSRNKFVQNILENYIPTAIVMGIEPMWILINRYLCLLQPFEELRKGNAKAKVSIDVNYSSLPPQLVIWKSLRARHIVLTAVCAMALLSNLLAVTFAGLFQHKTTEVWTLESFQPPFDATFVSINGSIGPVDSGLSWEPRNASGAYNGGNGKDQFYIAESNNTHHTPLPVWTDDTLFYMPFRLSSSPIPNVLIAEDRPQFEAETIGFGSELKCSGLVPSSYRIYNTSVGDKRLMVTLSNGPTEVNCRSAQQFVLYMSPKKGRDAEEPGCETGPSAAELGYTMEPLEGGNASQVDRGFCQSTAVLGWARSPEGTCAIVPEQILDSNLSFFVQCRPQLVRGRGTVRVDEAGRLLRPVHDRTVERDLSFDELKTHFKNDPINLISQSNRYMFPPVPNPWHNDMFASDPFNYFVSLKPDGGRLLDPNTSLPTLEDVQRPLREAYSNLFAIWLGANHHRLFVNASGSSTTAWRIEQKERLFVSVPLFGISLGILLAYGLVAVVVYLRRPGQFLPRLPTSIASTIGLFAASTAVDDLRGTSRFGTKERAQHLENLDTRYGYGNFVGVDGKIYVGIEKTPFVRPRHGAPRNKRTWGFQTTTKKGMYENET